jgi:Tn3 transposase DDE domain
MMCSTSYSERGRRSSFQTTTASPSRSAPAYGAARVGPNRQGEIRDRTFENQSSRASGLSLIAAAIVHWNPVRGLAIPYPFSRQRW